MQCPLDTRERIYQQPSTFGYFFLMGPRVKRWRQTDWIIPLHTTRPLSLNCLSYPTSHHIHKGHIEEDPSRDPKHPGSEGNGAQAEPHPQGRTPQSQGSRNQAQQQQLPKGQPFLKQHGKVTCCGENTGTEGVSQSCPSILSPANLQVLRDLPLWSPPTPLVPFLPSSWGSSWQKTARVVLRPLEKPSEKAAPISSRVKGCS